MTDVRSFKEYYGPGILDPDWQYLGYDFNDPLVHNVAQNTPQIVNNKLYFLSGYGGSEFIQEAIFNKLGEYPDFPKGILVKSNLDSTGLRPVFDTIAHINFHGVINSYYANIAVSPDETKIVYQSYDSGDLIWVNPANGDDYGTIKTYTNIGNDYVTTIKWAPDGSVVVWADGMGKLWSWDGNTVTEITYYDNNNIATRDAVSSKVLTTGDGSWTHTPNGTIGGVVVSIVIGNSTTTPVSVTYGGTAMTLKTGVIDSSGELGGARIYWLKDPPQGAQTVSVDVGATQTWLGSAISFSGSDLRVLNTYSSNDNNELNPAYTYTNGTSNNACLVAAYFAGNDTVLGGDVNTTAYNGGVFTNPVYTNEVQRLNITSYGAGDTFSLTFDGQTTGLISRGASTSATALNIKNALELLSSISPNTVTVSGTGNSGTVDFYVTFDNGTLRGIDVPQITVAANNGCTVTPSTTQEGSTAYTDSVGEFLHTISANSSYGSQTVGTATRTADDLAFAGIAIGGVNNPFFDTSYWGSHQVFGWNQDSSVIYYSHCRGEDANREWSIYSLTSDGVTRTLKFTKSTTNYRTFQCLGERDNKLWFLWNANYTSGPTSGLDIYACDMDGNNLVKKIDGTMASFDSILGAQLYGPNDSVYWHEYSDFSNCFVALGRNTIAQIPPNDNFVNAIELIGNTDTDTQLGVENSTIETNESENLQALLTNAGLIYDPLINSAWYKWTAPSNGMTHVDTFGSYWHPQATLWGWSDQIEGYKGIAYTTVIGFTGNSVDTVEFITGGPPTTINITELLTTNQQGIETDLTGFTQVNFPQGFSITRDTINYHDGAASLKINVQQPGSATDYRILLDGPDSVSGTTGWILPTIGANYIFDLWTYFPTDDDIVNLEARIDFYDASYQNPMPPYTIVDSYLSSATQTSGAWNQLPLGNTIDTSGSQAMILSLIATPKKYLSYDFNSQNVSGTGWTKHTTGYSWGTGGNWDLYDHDLHQIVLPAIPGTERWMIDVRAYFTPSNPANTGKLAIGGDGDLTPILDEDNVEMSNTIVGEGQLAVRGIVDNPGNKDILFYTDTVGTETFSQIEMRISRVGVVYIDTLSLTGSYDVYSAAGSGNGNMSLTFGGDVYDASDPRDIRIWYKDNSDWETTAYDDGNGHILFNAQADQTYYFAVGKYWTFDPLYEIASTTINLNHTPDNNPPLAGRKRSAGLIIPN